MKTGIIELTNISKAFDKNIIFEKFNYQFHSAKAYGVLGANGKGKTTLLKCIAQRAQVDSGSIKFNLQENLNSSEAIAFVTPSEFGFLDLMTVAENLRAFGSLQGSSEQNINDIAKTLQLDSFLNVKYRFCSRAQKYLTHLARALLKPHLKILIIDEAFAYLDANNEKNLVNILSEFKSERQGCVIVSAQEKQQLRGAFDEILSL